MPQERKRERKRYIDADPRHAREKRGSCSAVPPSRRIYISSARIRGSPARVFRPLLSLSLTYAKWEPYACNGAAKCQRTHSVRKSNDVLYIFSFSWIIFCLDWWVSFNFCTVIGMEEFFTIIDPKRIPLSIYRLYLILAQSLYLQNCPKKKVFRHQRYLWTPRSDNKIYR